MEDGGFLRTVGEQPQTAGAADGVRIADGSSPTRDQIVNESIRQYFMRVYEKYCSKADPNDMMKRMMEEVIS